MVFPIPERTQPLYGNGKEQNDCSCNCWITTVALGVILLIAGIVLISGAFGNFNIPGYICVAIGLAALAIGSCIRCCAKNKSELNNHVNDAAANQQAGQTLPNSFQRFEVPTDNDLLKNLKDLDDAFQVRP
jgi:hypothetical protein